MPVTPTYPGVYVEEVPSGVRTIVGVATSITAFIGRAERGPTNEPITINSYADFERTFGGLSRKYPMSFAVRDFYLNGGSQAIIVRLYKLPKRDEPAPAACSGTALPEDVANAAQRVADAARKATDLKTLQLIDMDKSVTGPRDEYQKAVDEATKSEFALKTARLNEAQARAELDRTKKLFETALEALRKIIVAGGDPTEAQKAALKAKEKVDGAKSALDEKTQETRTAEGKLDTDRKKVVEKAAVKAAAEAVANVVVKKATEADVSLEKVQQYLKDELLDANDKVKADALRAKGVSSGEDVPARSKAIISLDGGRLTLEAANEGDWGNSLWAKVDNNDITEEVARSLNLPKADLFNLTIKDNGTGVEERLRNLTIDAASSRSVKRVLETQSRLVRVCRDREPTGRPSDGSTDTVASENRAAASAPLDNEADYDAAFTALDKADLFNLLCIPPDTVEGTVKKEILQKAMKYCADHRAMLIVDPPADWATNRDTAADTAKKGLDDLGLSGVAARNAAIYFPRVIQSDPTMEGQLDTFAPCGIVAGVMARTDAQRGVWKAPAGLDAAIIGVQGLQVVLNDAENGMLNPLGINCLRAFPVYGRVVWGARTLRGADQLADEYKYVPVRRLALYIEESLYRGLKWVVFEPNDEPLWAQIRLNVGAFMHNLFRQGAFQGTTPREAYFVKCDKETTTDPDRNLGIVNILVGFAPLKPAEFVIIKLQQMAGQIQT